jgi:hypothetical protein
LVARHPHRGGDRCLVHVQAGAALDQPLHRLPSSTLDTNGVVRRSLMIRSLRSVLAATVRGAPGSRVPPTNGLARTRMSRRHPNDPPIFIRQGWPQAMNHLPEIDGQAPCYPSSAQLTQHRERPSYGATFCVVTSAVTSSTASRSTVAGPIPLPIRSRSQACPCYVCAPSSGPTARALALDGPGTVRWLPGRGSAPRRRPGA